MKWDVSIGIPVYNGEDLLENTLKFLMKHHGDVREIIISDNASTDKTPEICQTYAEKYPIIKYIRQKNYITAMDNWKEALKPATGKYFIWVGHHDLISENYFSETVPLLEKNCDATVALPKTYLYRPPFKKANLIPQLNPSSKGIDSEEKRDRIYAILTNPTMCHTINQLFRTDFLRKMSDEIFLRDYMCIDVVVPLYAAVLGKFVAAPNAAYYYWMRKPESVEETNKRYSVNTKIKSLVNNHKHYVPRIFWELCKKYAADLSDELLKTDIDFALCHIYDIYMNDDDWFARKISQQSKEQAPDYRAYSAIHTALKDEKVSSFYRHLRFGQKSPFESMAKEIALNSYTRMLQILLDEKYIHPNYRLNREETTMLNELMTLKAENMSS